MAGGKKTKASKKKGPAKATSSAPQPFPYLDGSFLEFGSEEELSRFLTHFAKRPISPPRVLPKLFHQQKGSINLYDIEIDFPTFARIEGLPIRGDDIATYEAVIILELEITNLIRHIGAPMIHSAPPEKRLLLYILTRILCPWDGSHTSLFNEDLKVIHAIMHGASINWAKFVMIHMTDCASIATERSLPCAFLVMDLIVSTDIHIAGPSTMMTKLWYMERIDSTLQRQHHDMTAFFHGINYVPPPFDSTSLGHNFEGEDEDNDSYAPSSSPDEADFEDAVDGDAMDIEDDEDDDEDKVADT
ncbi:unnamed protein product [Cuscuta campestris]|uniref:Uncharacterized protein n=1 Tax=Cuscuta campestris TaxID=132261 RepID=A0A484MZM7_9ASTE|nr:unnamed protein product [Cuscuta campestris]